MVCEWIGIDYYHDFDADLPASIRIAQEIIAVSYTHLDVYKRQVTRWFWILLNIFNNVCWKHAKWNGDNLICEKCGKLSGFKVPVNRGGKTFYFYPTTQEGLMHQTEICDRYKLLNMTLSLIHI